MADDKKSPTPADFPTGSRVYFGTGEDRRSGTVAGYDPDGKAVVQSTAGEKVLALSDLSATA